VASVLDPIIDERGSPKGHEIAAGTPILQPTDERRRTGSHYTPRSLTEPIVRYALEPAFEQLGPNVTPEQILNLKVCDPAMGSGAFLVEACRAIAARLVKAWEVQKDKKPIIPPDEDEELHARRLVAQRCLYGVDKNPLAVDLAKLSLWLATLARDHEFTFLDHALKPGDSLVGLTQEQIAAVHWDTSKPGLPLFRQLVKDRVAEAMKGRAEIQVAPDNTARSVQEARHRSLEMRMNDIRLIGDGVIAAFFAEQKSTGRETRRVEVESLLSGSMKEAWAKLAAIAATLSHRAHPLSPFHWKIEFPEVFQRENGGFDAIVGNPPFLGGKIISTNLGDEFSHWIAECHPGGSRSADLVAHFFRRAFSLLRKGGVAGLVATNTIGQGDTRDAGLAVILESGGSILRAKRRLEWPGEAAVVVSVLHFGKDVSCSPILDDRPARRISAYLVEGDLDRLPDRLGANAQTAFVGSYVLGMGFTFDDDTAEGGAASTIDEMHRLIQKDPRNSERIFPYIGAEELNTDPRHSPDRYVIDFFDRPLGRRGNLKSWSRMTDSERSECRTRGLVPLD
jgi:N-6 DNA Methylase